MTDKKLTPDENKHPLTDLNKEPVAIPVHAPDGSRDNFLVPLSPDVIGQPERNLGYTLVPAGTPVVWTSSKGTPVAMTDGNQVKITFNPEEYVINGMQTAATIVPAGTPIAWTKHAETPVFIDGKESSVPNMGIFTK